MLEKILVNFDTGNAVWKSKNHKIAHWGQEHLVLKVNKHYDELNAMIPQSYFVFKITEQIPKLEETFFNKDRFGYTCEYLFHFPAKHNPDNIFPGINETE